MTTEYPWYGLVDEEKLEQGDFIDKCPVFIPEYNSMPKSLSVKQEAEGYDIIGEWQEYDVIVMSQSCDLANSKLKVVIVGPYWSLNELGEQHHDFLLPKTQEEIRRGYRPGYHMLNMCDLEEKKHEIQVVDLLTVYSIPYDFLIQLAKDQGKRLRLLSPYQRAFITSVCQGLYASWIARRYPSFPREKVVKIIVWYYPFLPVICHCAYPLNLIYPNRSNARYAAEICPCTAKRPS